MTKFGAFTALVSVLGLAPAANALPVFYTVLAQGFSGSAPTASTPRILYEVDFATGGMGEIGDIGIEATAFVAEPGTGRLLAWVDHTGAGLYEVDPLTGTSTLIGSATSALGIDELVFTPSGSLHALSNDLILFQSGPTYEVDLVSAALTQVSSGGSTPVTALTYEPDGGSYWTENDRLFSTDTGGLFYEPVDATGLAANDTTLFMVGATHYSPPVVIGSTSYLSAIKLTMHSHGPFPITECSEFEVLPSSGNSLAIGLARVPEPVTGLLIASGLVLLAYWGRRRD